MGLGDSSREHIADVPNVTLVAQCQLFRTLQPRTVYKNETHDVAGYDKN